MPFFVVALLVFLVGLGALVARSSHRWLLSPPGSAARQVTKLGAGICLLVAAAPAPELLSYPVYAGGMMHFPVLGRVAAFVAALFSLGLFATMAILLWRRGERGAGTVAGVLGLLPLPIHLLVMFVVAEALGGAFLHEVTRVGRHLEQAPHLAPAKRRR